MPRVLQEHGRLTRLSRTSVAGRIAIGFVLLVAGVGAIFIGGRTRHGPHDYTEASMRSAINVLITSAALGGEAPAGMDDLIAANDKYGCYSPRVTWQRDQWGALLKPGG